LSIEWLHTLHSAADGAMEAAEETKCGTTVD